MTRHTGLYCRFIRNLFLPLCLLVGSLCFSQVAVSVLNGTVTDPSGSMIPNAKLVLSSLEKGSTRTIASSSGGTYTFPDLAPGTYSISVEASGFKKTFLPLMTLYVGQTSTQNFHLEIGTVNEQVEVSDEATLLNTTNGELGTVITGTLIEQLPLNGRNILQLNLLSPGAISDKSGATGNAVMLSPAAVTFSVNGEGSDNNMYLLDGIEIKDWQHGTAMFSPSVDSVEEFQTTTSNYSAVFGAEAAAQINMVVKSASDKFHGTVWEYLRNDVLNAKNYFQPTGTSQPFKRNEFGGNIGGPLTVPHLYSGKGRTFFFFNYEGFRQAVEGPLTGYLPTPAQLGGDLSALMAPGTLINPFTGVAFPRSIIPPSMIRPANLSKFLTNGIGNGPWIPAPNTSAPGINYINGGTSHYNSNQYVTRIDHRISDKTSIYGHYAYNGESLISPNLNPNWHQSQNSDAYSVGVHLVHLFSSAFLFDVSAGYSHFTQNSIQSTAGKNDITNSILGIQGNATNPSSWGAPVWSVAGFGNLGEVAQAPRQWLINTLDFRPSVTLTRSKHNLQFGMDFQRVNEDFQEIFISNGIWSFNGSFSGNGLGDFLLGLPASVGSSPDPFAPNMYNSTFGPYFQDDWKLAKRLTVNLGLRYEWVGIPLSHNNRSIANMYFPPNNGIPVIVIADDAKAIKFQGVQASLYSSYPFVRTGAVGVPEQLAKNDNLDWSPRLGFAYSLPGTKEGVLRGGYGVFYDESIQDNWVEAAVDPPFIRNNLTILDSTNFATFSPTNPYANVQSSAAQVFGNQIDHRMGRTQEWNLTLEATRWNNLFSIGYVGSASSNLPDLEDPNMAVPGPGSIAARRRWPTAGVFYIAGNNGYGNYNGLQTKIQRRYSNGLEYLASYTWSRALNTSDGTFVGEGGRGWMTQNLLNPQTEYGVAAQNLSQRFVMSGLYELPFGKKKRFLNAGGLSNALLGGWQVNGITTVSSGSPFTVDQTDNGANVDVGDSRCDTIGNPRLSHRTVAKFFNTAAFAMYDPVNGVYRFGNTGRNTVTGPDSVDTDLSLYKKFPIHERGLVEFRFEAFNVFNHPIFGQPISTLGYSGFGALTSTAIDPREIQAALRLSF